MKVLLSFAILFTVAVDLHAQIDRVKGFLEPSRSIELAAGEMGILSQVFVEEGQQVQAGDIVAALDDQVLAASRSIAANSQQARGKLNSAQAELAMQLEMLEKIEGLYERNHASQTELDRVRGQFQISQAQVEIVRDELKQRELELARIDAQIEQRKIRSPISGIVIDVVKDAGEFVSPSEPVVATVVQLDPLTVTFLVPQTLISRYKVGQKVELEMGLRRKKTYGTVEFVSPIADAQTNTCRTKIVIPNKERKWESGTVSFLNLSTK